MIEMRQFLKKVSSREKAAVNHIRDGFRNPAVSRSVQEEGQSSSIKDPTPLEVIRYRYHHGVNLGSVYVLEKWLTPSAFPPNVSDAQTSELAAVTLWTKQIGIDGTRSKFEDRWNSCVNSNDWDWLCNNAHCTSIRLPIGYFTLGPNFCNNTPFAPYSEVYTNCWATVKTLVSHAKACGIGVLIDFHAAPGGANAGDHSGTNSGKAELWNNQANLSLAQKCLEFIASEIASGSMDNVIGLQVCNEAVWGAPGMYQWYDSVLAGIATHDPSIPVYISDAWDLGQAIPYVKTKNTVTLGSGEPATNPVCIDDHIYFCFTDQDKSCSPQQILPLVSQQLGQMDGKDGSVLDSGAASVIVGEYSCVLNDATWSKGGNYDKNQLLSQFGKAQCQRFEQKAGGSYFWNFKMDWMDGGEWGFVAQTNSGAICPPGNLTLSASDVKAAISRAQSQQSTYMQGSVSAHVNYWKQAAPGMKTDHSNFGSGWSVGWNDALTFFSMRVNGGLPGGGGGGDKIGLLDLWVRKRLAESGMTGDFVWEFEQGFRKGVADFYSCAGV